MSILVSFIIGLVFALIGWMLMKYPPENINSSLGYKTPFAMKNKETWKEGNRFCGKMLFIGGIIFIPFSIFFRYLYINNISLSLRISLMGLLVIAIACIVYTEIHLKIIFDKTGIRK
ncbi:SdpI family protein [Clostridium manihotivorum]|uniref:SdpI family protein n=1 Tax=Clostridium manihotivorum TaxID=2320868 RepID=A0A410DW22_9CLOT|nr:SdpI family protein [Clostridium manihotivorum]QAA33112.1 hypothetical protein C1I91_16520 [Clostridium manihotivorum]